MHDQCKKRRQQAKHRVPSSTALVCPVSCFSANCYTVCDRLPPHPVSSAPVRGPLQTPAQPPPTLHVSSFSAGTWEKSSPNREQTKTRRPAMEIHTAATRNRTGTLPHVHNANRNIALHTTRASYQPHRKTYGSFMSRKSDLISPIPPFCLNTSQK